MAGMGSKKVLFGLLLAGGAAWMLGDIETRPNDSSEHREVRVGRSSDAKLPASRRRERLPPPKWGDHITVLSIDGGGIRGLIPAVVLAALERNLQDVEKEENPNGDWEDARIADYFDVIAGTSTGGLIAAMLTTPDENIGLPKFAAGEIEGHYRDIGSKIFTPRRGRGFSWHSLKSYFSGPDYDSTFLHKEIEEITGGNTLADTLTNVVMPAFDVRRLYPIIFSSYKPPYDPFPGEPKERKENLSDVCKGTSAAPTYFRAHQFHAVNEDNTPQEWGEFHLIDGGVGANNPTMVAIMRIAREVLCQTNDEDFFANKRKMTEDFKPVLNYKDFVVISIGTGSTREADRAAYKADDCSNWSPISWIYNKVEGCDRCRSAATAGWIPGTAEDRDRWGLIGRILNKADYYTKLIHKYREHRTRKPIIDMLMHASDALVDYNVAMLLRGQGCDHYLRIQTELEEKNMSMDDVTETNMQELTNIGRQLLKKKVSGVNAVTGRYQVVRRKKTKVPANAPSKNKVPTNEEELKRFAQTLCKERKRRLINKSAAEGVKPTP